MCSAGSMGLPTHHSVRAHWEDKKAAGHLQVALFEVPWPQGKVRKCLPRPLTLPPDSGSDWASEHPATAWKGPSHPAVWICGPAQTFSDKYKHPAFLTSSRVTQLLVVLGTTPWRARQHLHNLLSLLPLFSLPEAHKQVSSDCQIPSPLKPLPQFSPQFLISLLQSRSRLTALTSLSPSSLLKPLLWLLLLSHHVPRIISSGH